MAAGVNIAAKDLTWSSRGGAPVLAGVSFTLEPGTIMACLGPNGAGKTTLLNLLSGWSSPNSGSIAIEGRRHSSLTPEQAFRFGIVRRFDPPKIIRELTIFDNLCLAAAPAPPQGILAAFVTRKRIAAAEADIRRRAAPILQSLGMEDMLHRQAGTLSIGEQKLLDFAIAMLSAPGCLLLDEPLKDRVDDRRKDAVSRSLRAFAEAGGSALVVEHDLPFVRNTADRVLVLGQDGKVVWNGRAADDGTWAAVEQVYHRHGPDARLVQPREKNTTSTSETTRMGVPYRLSASGLTARYKDTAVLFDASLQLSPGEIAVLRGENGAGKSTLLFALAGLVDASGTVRLDGEDITGSQAYMRARRGLILVAQEHKVFPSMTVAENILLGNESSNETRRSLLDRAFFWFPELRNRANVTSAHLSAGQKQMVALARAFLQSPHCLLLDEPTSGLDPGMRARVRNLIREVAQAGTAVLMVEHVREADEGPVHSTYFLRGGHLTPPPALPAT
jgi:branched-chain amino acid transport system ATP-binding protein